MPARFDARDVGTVNARAPGQLRLGKPGRQAQRAQTLTEPHAIDPTESGGTFIDGAVPARAIAD